MKLLLFLVYDKAPWKALENVVANCKGWLAKVKLKVENESISICMGNEIQQNLMQQTFIIMSNIQNNIDYLEELEHSIFSIGTTYNNFKVFTVYHVLFICLSGHYTLSYGSGWADDTRYMYSLEQSY